MRSLRTWLCTFALLLAGCGKNDTPTPETAGAPVEQPAVPEAAVDSASPVPTPSPTAAQPQAPVSPAPAAQVQPVQVEVLEGSVHAFMTMQLQKFINENQRMPKDFSEFTSAKMDSVPFPPEGMEFIIDYANKQVKVVKRKTK